MNKPRTTVLESLKIYKKVTKIWTEVSFSSTDFAGLKKKQNTMTTRFLKTAARGFEKFGKPPFSP